MNAAATPLITILAIISALAIIMAFWAQVYLVRRVDLLAIDLGGNWKRKSVTSIAYG